jgi:hypothetical protein
MLLDPTILGRREAAADGQLLAAFFGWRERIRWRLGQVRAAIVGHIRRRVGFEIAFGGARFADRRHG